MPQRMEESSKMHLHFKKSLYRKDPSQLFFVRANGPYSMNLADFYEGIRGV